MFGTQTPRVLRQSAASYVAEVSGVSIFYEKCSLTQHCRKTVGAPCISAFGYESEH